MIEQKSVFITGAGQGIGRGCASALADSGYSLLINDINEELLNSLANEINYFGVSCTTILADAFSESTINQIDSIFSDLPLWGVVCNAYKSIKKPLLKFNRDEFKEVLKAVYESHCFIAQIAAKRMIALGRGGRIIFIGSVYGTLINRVHSSPYDTGKAALEELSRILALELAPYRITVNCVTPGFTDTPGERQFATEEQIATLSHKIPLGRACRPDDIASAVKFLMSDEAEMITGIVLPVTGGMHIADPYG